MKVNLCIQFQNDSEAGAGITSGDIASVDGYCAVLSELEMAVQSE